MSTVLVRIDRAIGLLSGVMAVLAAALISMVTVLICADIAGRQLDRPFAGTVAIASTSVVAVAFLALPYTLRRGAHVRSMLLRDRLGAGARTATDVSVLVLAGVVFAVIAYAAWAPMVSAWSVGEYIEGGLRVPEAPARSALFVASVLMAVECLMAMFRTLGLMSRKETS